MHRGGTLLSPTIAYETWGKLNHTRDNAVLIFTGMSPSAHAASSPEDPTPGWWEEIIGPGRPIDTRRYFVICVNSLGSCFGSTGPASVDPRTGRHLSPEVSCAVARRRRARRVRGAQHLGVERLVATVGPSMGGMTALAFEILFPGMSEGFLSMSSGPRSLPFSIALRSLQREIIRKDPGWHGRQLSARLRSRSAACGSRASSA